MHQNHWKQVGLLLVLQLGLLLSLVLPIQVLPAQATSIYEIPVLAAGEPTWVVDEADVLSRLSEGQVSGQLKQLAAQTGTEVRFVVFRRLDYGVSIDQFAQQIFERWFPTPEEQAQQVVVVLDTITNTAAVYTGSQDSALTPDIAESVANETMLQPMRQGARYNQAVTDATTRLVAVLSGKPDPGPPAIADDVNVESTFASVEETKESNAIPLVIILLILATVIPMVTYYVYVR